MKSGKSSSADAFVLRCLDLRRKFTFRAAAAAASSRQRHRPTDRADYVPRPRDSFHSRCAFSSRSSPILASRKSMGSACRCSAYR